MEKSNKISTVKSIVLNNSDWTLISKENNIVTKSKKINNSQIECFMSHGLVNKSIDTILKELWNVYDNIDNIKLHDDSIIEYDIVEKINSSERVCRQVNYLGWPLWNRESVYYQTIEKFNNGCACILMYSIDSDKVPINTSEYVRTNIMLSAIYLELINDNITKVYRIAQVDPCGYIPTTITNQYVNKSRDIILLLQKN